MRSRIAQMLAASLLLVGLSACAPAGGGSTSPSSDPAPSATPSATASPTPSDPGEIVIGTRGFSVRRDGVETQYALDGSRETITSLFVDLLGGDPTCEDVPDMIGAGSAGEACAWPSVTVAETYDRVSVTIRAPSVGGVPVATASGLRVGSTRADALAAGAWDVWDEDGDGIADHLGVDPVEVSDATSLTNPGQPGRFFINLDMEGDAITAISIPANDFSDL